MMNAFRNFAKNDRGGSTVEFALVIAVFLLLFFTVIEFARIWWTWNSANKAAQVGVRVAVVSTPASQNMKTFDAIAAGLVPGNGEPVAIGAIADTTCTSAGCDFGSGDSLDSAAFQQVVTAMQQVFPAIQTTNVRIIYRHVGLGFAGNPFGGVADFTPTVTIELIGLQFQSIVGNLIGVTTINLPTFSSTLTGEDLST